jgi:cold shock CspA family protein
VTVLGAVDAVPDRVEATVTAFDEAVGLGTARLGDGREVPFHATQLRDGTRRVDVGARVSGVVVAWHLGRDELADLAATR